MGGGIMPIDTSNIDIKAVIDQLACIGWKKPVRSRGETVYKGGPCPFCQQGTDRFAVFPDAEKPHFYCGINGNGCGASGDVINFVRLIKGYASAGQAIRELQAMGFLVGDASVAPYRATMRPERDKPCQKWQDMGNALIHAAQQYLWSPVGKRVVDYLHGRGLSDETMLRFRLGYWPKWTEYTLSDWGLEGDGTFWIRPGIFIPCTEKDVLWSINQRITTSTPREREQIAQGKQLPRYRQIRGSGNGLFNVDAIQPGEPLFVTEGEIDAMTITQETGYSAVATRSTKGAQTSRWIGSLSLASHLFIAFDNDGGKGEKAAAYWTESIFPDQASYWQPWAKDVNEMLQRGQDLALWASQGIAALDIVFAPCPPIVEEQAKREAEQAGQDIVPRSDDPRDNPVVQEAVRLFGATMHIDPFGYTLLQHVQKLRRPTLAQNYWTV
jgi:DNA primase